jgi:hypothetical protein
MVKRNNSVDIYSCLRRSVKLDTSLKYYETKIYNVYNIFTLKLKQINDVSVKKLIFYSRFEDKITFNNSNFNSIL